MATKLVTYYEKLSPIKSTILWTRGHVSSRDKLKTYLPYHNAYGNQTL